jgi:hypothetical protein
MRDFPSDPDLKRGTNKDIGPKDIFEMGSTKNQGKIDDSL